VLREWCEDRVELIVGVPNLQPAICSKGPCLLYLLGIGLGELIVREGAKSVAAGMNPRSRRERP